MTDCGPGLEPTSRRRPSCSGPHSSVAARKRAAVIYKQVLSLLLAQRRPSHYLLLGHEDLEQLSNSYLRLMADAGVISAELRDLATAARLQFRDDLPPAVESSFIDSKATNVMRAHLMSLLQAPQFYDLDRLDMQATSSLDAATQQRVIDKLRTLSDPSEAARLGLIGERLLSKGDARGVSYSVTVYERSAGVNCCACKPITWTGRSISTKAASLISDRLPSCGPLLHISRS